MKGAIDMYRKISPDLVVATNRGGAFSIGAIVLMSYLGFVRDLGLVGSGDVREKIDVELGLSPARINIDIEFPKLNCDDATVELWRGKSRAATHGLERTLRVRRFDDATKTKSALPEDSGRRQGRHVRHAGCKLQGFIAYEHTSRYGGYKRPGGFRSQSSCRRFYLRHACLGRRELDSGLYQKGTRRPRLPRLQRARYLSPSADKVFHHFVHVVPTKYQLSNRRGFTAFQLLHQNHLSHQETEGETVVTRFGFDISPMTALVSNRSAKRWYDYITSLLSILGGRSPSCRYWSGSPARWPRGYCGIRVLSESRPSAASTRGR